MRVWMYYRLLRYGNKMTSRVPILQHSRAILFFFCISMIIGSFIRRHMATSSSTTSAHPLVDIGANLTHKSFKNNLSQVLQRASKAQVSQIIITGTNLAASREALRLATRFNQEQPLVKLYSTVGIHPHDATRHISYNYRDQLIEILQANSKKATNPIVALGECGLDFDRNFSAPDDQRAVFDTQLQLACEFDLPLFMHERSAASETIAMLEKHSRHQNFRGVIHCFTNGSLDVLRRYLALNLHIGITGWVCDDRRGQDLAKLIPHIPLDRLLIETDAPFLMPRNHPRPWPDCNEPSCLPYIVKKLAECYAMTTDEIARQTTDNAKKLFNLWPSATEWQCSVLVLPAKRADEFRWTIRYRNVWKSATVCNWSRALSGNKWDHLYSSWRILSVGCRDGFRLEIDNGALLLPFSGLVDWKVSSGEDEIASSALTFPKMIFSLSMDDYLIVITKKKTQLWLFAIYSNQQQSSTSIGCFLRFDG